MRFDRWMLVAVLMITPLLAAAQEVDLNTLMLIREQGLRSSQALETARVLSDEIGSRLTNSPGYRRAEEWTTAKLKEWGLSDVHLEAFEFGRGWSYSSVSARMTKPEELPLDIIPKAWTPGTNGSVRGVVLRVAAETEEDIEKLKGKLAGKIIFLDKPRDLKPPEGQLFTRYDDKQLEELETFPISDQRRPEFRDRMNRMRIGRKLTELAKTEGALIIVEISSRDGGLLTAAGNRSYKPGDDSGLPGVVMSAEQYNRICRLIDKGKEVELEIAINAQFHETDTKGRNVIAEIPGTDKKDEIVMAGAHLDSWHGGTGATDNAAGCAVVMDAVRILKAIGVKPRRTIRIGLWSSEEQGFNGSRAYVSEHFASRPEPPAPTTPDPNGPPPDFRRNRGPLTFKPGYNKLSAYYNIDNGAGKLRGIYGQENLAAMPIFAAWLKPLADLGATTVTSRRTGGTDHASFDGVGLPGFQFIQDELDYDTRTHHSQVDVFDRLQAADLMQASVVLASFLYNTAMMDKPMPRKPLPAEATATPTPAPSAPAKATPVSPAKPAKPAK
jgi:carboxypeptidase Q